MLNPSKQATDHANQALTNVTATRVESSVTVQGVSGTKLVGKHLCIESWHSDDFSQWYRIYDDGWKECGGIGSMVSGGSGDYTDVIAFPVTFNNVPTAHLNLVYPLAIWDKPFYITHLTNTKMGFYKYSTVEISWTWSACGY